MPTGIYKRIIPSSMKGKKRPPFSDEWKENLRKGHIGINAKEKHPLWGKHHSEETKKKISESEKGKIESIETRQKKSKSHMGIVSPNKGKTFSKEWKEKLSKSHVGINTWIKGTKQTAEHIAKKSPPKGEKNWKWKGGVTPINEKIRKSVEYKLWRKSVFERDNYTCRFCGIKSVEGKFVLMHADHIKRFCDYPELRFAIDNGRTLCVPCHRTTETYGTKGNKKQK